MMQQSFFDAPPDPPSSYEDILNGVRAWMYRVLRYDRKTADEKQELDRLIQCVADEVWRQQQEGIER